MFVAGEVVALLQHGRNPCAGERREAQKTGERHRKNLPKMRLSFVTGYSGKFELKLRRH